MSYTDIFKSLLPKKKDSETESTNDTAASGADTGTAHAMDPGKVEIAISDIKDDEEQMKASFQLALDQSNGEMIGWLRSAGFNPPASMRSSDGKTVDQKMAQMNKAPENPAMALPAKALAQVSSIQLDTDQWMRGLSLSNTLSLPALPPRSMSLA